MVTFVQYLCNASHSKSRRAHYCRVMPPDKFNSMITIQLSVYPQCITAVRSYAEKG